MSFNWTLFAGVLVGILVCGMYIVLVIHLVSFLEDRIGGLAAWLMILVGVGLPIALWAGVLGQ